MEAAALGLKVTGVDSIDRASTSLDKLAQSGKTAESAASSLNSSSRNSTKALADVSRESDRASRSMSALASAIRPVAAGLAAAFSVRSLAQYADSWSDMTSLVRVNIGAHEDAAEVMERLADIARSTYSSLELTAQGFAQNAFTLNALGKTTKQQLDYTAALNNALVVSGAKGQQAQIVQDSLNRAMAEGSLRGQELQNVLNYGSTVAALLAEELGVNVTQLREVAKEGRITADVIFNALVKNMELLEETAETMPATIGDAFLLMRNSVLQAVGVFDQANGISEAFAENLVSVADAIRKVDLEPVIAAAKVLVSVIGARLASSALASAAAFAAAQIEAIRYQAALASMAGVSRTTAVGLTAMSAATRTATAAMALVGGPAGAIMLAAGALVYFATRASEAEREAEALDSRIAKLGGSFDKLTVAQASAAILDYEKKLESATFTMQAAEARAFTLRRNLEQFPNSRKAEQWAVDLIRAEGAVDDARAEVDAINSSLERLNGIVQAGGSGALADDADKASDAFNKLNKEMRERLLLVGLNSEADRLAARIREGYVEGLKEGEGDILVALQRQIDSAERAAEASKAAADEEKRRQDALRSSFEGILEGYQRQIALGESASETEQLLYEIQHGRLQGLLPAQQQMLRNLAEEIDRRKQLADINRERDTISRELMTEEERIKESYARRRAIIENATFESEQARTELLLRLEKERNEALIEANGSYWDRWLLAAEENLSSFDELSKTVVDSFTQQFGNAFADMILEAETLGEAVRGIAQGMVRAIVVAIGEMIAQWLAYQAVQLATGKATRASASAAMISQAAAMQQLAALSAYASTAAIPIVGPAAAPAAALAATAATSPFVAAVTAASLTGMAHDGIDSVPKTGTWLLEKGERITTAETSAKLDRTLSSVQRHLEGNSSRGSGELKVEINNNTGAQVTAQRVQTDRGQILQVLIDDINENGPWSRTMQSNFGVSYVGR